MSHRSILNRSINFQGHVRHIEGCFPHLVMIVMSFVQIGCYARVKPVDEKFIGSEHKIEKSYLLGEQVRVFVGESMLRVRDFYVKKYQSPFLTPNSDFRVKLGLTSCEGFKGKRYRIAGQTEKKGRIYRVIFVPTTKTTFSASGYLGLLVDMNGFLHNKVLNRHYAVQVGSASYAPSNLRFYPISDERVDVSRGYLNCELVFSGIDGNSIRLTYREYTPQHLAKPAFFQDLTYDINSTVIRFKKIKMTIHKVDNEEIAFTVLEDGLEQKN